ncbi:hypothetical protein TanjilG_04754 [Lupinus angustifolius]|uniref:Uncharacterized protein n=1 Tax=Lupinus angustifolius TaxID=3871 RepID=A0A4P1RK43_LUPAN|nr:hypothetical protein TanjilG_04754 [Lupinus angustifolius]
MTMDSSATLNLHHHAKLVPKQCHTFPSGSYLSSRRTPSFSSSCSSLESLYFHDDPLHCPSTPLRFLGVPFSWEYLPGIPKNQNSKKNKDSSMKTLPLPPPTNSSKNLNHEETRVRKKNNTIQSSVQRDPFFAAMVECSKDDNNDKEISGSLWSGAKFTFQPQEEAPISMLVTGFYEFSAFNDALPGFQSCVHVCY